MSEARLTSAQLEVLTKANAARITSTQLEVLYRAAGSGSARITSTQLEVLYISAAIKISGIAVDPTQNDIIIIGDSGAPVSYDLHRSLTPGFTLNVGNKIQAGITPTGLPQTLSDLTITDVDWYFYKVVENNAGGTLVSNEIAIESLGYGTPPVLSVSNTTGTEALLSVHLDPIYTEVHYVIALDVDPYYLSLIFEVSDTSSSRFLVLATGLTNGVTYRAKANWLGPLGWSGYSNEVVFLSAATISPATFDTIVRPKFGETIRGTYIVTWPSLQGGEIADLDISDDLGATWTNLASGLTGTTYYLNTLLYANGVDYLLRITGDLGTVYYQLCFYIDNATAGDYYWHDDSGYDVDVYDPTKFVKALNVNGNWQGHITGTNFAMLAQGGGTDLSLLLAKAIQRHTDLDITTNALADSGEGGYPWALYWAAEGLEFGVAGLVNNYLGVGAFIFTGLIWPYGTYPAIYGPGPEKGSSTSSKFVVQLASNNFGSAYPLAQHISLARNLPRIYTRQRGYYDMPLYSIRLKVTHPDRTNFPYRVRVRATTFGPGLLLPVNFVSDYWLIDETFDLTASIPPFTEYPFDCGCAGALGGKIHGSSDEGRAEYSTLGAAVLDVDCIDLGGSVCTGVPVVPVVNPNYPIPVKGPIPCIVCAVIPNFVGDSATLILGSDTENCGSILVSSDDDNGLPVNYKCA